MTDCCICIQCFNKPEETKHVLSSLEKCYGLENYNLLLFIDKAHPNSKSLPKNMELIQELKKYSTEAKNFYKSIELVISSNNLGPYKACYEIVERGLQKNKYVIFSEDDITFCKDTLNYFSECFKLREFTDPFCAGISSSSVYFGYSNKNNFKILNGQIDCTDNLKNQKCQIQNEIKEHHLINCTERVNWAPNKQFGLTREKWDLIKFFRTDNYMLNKTLNTCAPDEATGHFVKSKNLYYLFSIVPRSNDIGLYNEYGCTTLYYNGQPSPDTIKAVTSDDFEIYNGAFTLIQLKEVSALQAILSKYQF